MTQTNLTLVSYGAGDAECLQTFTDCSSSVSGSGAALLDCDCAAYSVSPLCILEADGLNALNQLVNVKALSLGDFSSLFDGVNVILCENSKNLLFSSLIRFK